MVIIEEKNLGEDSSSQSNNNNIEQTFYTGRGRGKGQGGRGQIGSRGRNSYQGQQQDQESYDSNRSARGRGNFQGRGSQKGRKNDQMNDADNNGCQSCDRSNHFARDCPTPNQGNRQQQNNYTSTSNQNDSKRLFVMQHMLNFVTIDVSTYDENVSYVDLMLESYEKPL